MTEPAASLADPVTKMVHNCDRDTTSDPPEIYLKNPGAPRLASNRHTEALYTAKLREITKIKKPAKNTTGITDQQARVLLVSALPAPDQTNTESGPIIRQQDAVLDSLETSKDLVLETQVPQSDSGGALTESISQEHNMQIDSEEQPVLQQQSMPLDLAEGLDNMFLRERRVCPEIQRKFLNDPPHASYDLPTYHSGGANE